jgi:2-dehydro-3-deoxyphosphogluconate aldolase/(4S)-4-hydroxy-2-oxoglutarate aldolase
MKKSEVIANVFKEGVVAVVRGKSTKQAVDTAVACVKGGIKLIEVTFTVPRADEIIKALSDMYDGTDVVVGAGTVLDDVTARIAILAGAKFVVSPALNVDTIKLCNRYGVAVMSGVSTPTEAITALEYGVEILKLFPGDIAKPNGLKAFKAPLPYANIMPTGGVSNDNVEEWFKAGACAIGAGGNITKGAESGDYAAVENASRELVLKVKSIIGGRK